MKNTPNKLAAGLNMFLQEPNNLTVGDVNLIVDVVKDLAFLTAGKRVSENFQKVFHFLYGVFFFMDENLP